MLYASMVSDMAYFFSSGVSRPLSEGTQSMKAPVLIRAVNTGTENRCRVYSSLGNFLREKHVALDWVKPGIEKMLAHLRNINVSLV